MDDKIKPISFQEVINEVHKEIPDGIIDAINHFIKSNFNPYKMESKVEIHEIASYYEGKENKGWLREHLIKCWGIEELYNTYGWDVTLFTPSKLDKFKPYFIFTKK